MMMNSSILYQGEDGRSISEVGTALSVGDVVTAIMW